MRTIFKTKLWFNESYQIVKLPEGFELLSLQVQDHQPTMWYICDSEAPHVETEIMMCGTGWNLESEIKKKNYLGTLQNGPLVWHFFKLG